MIDAELIDIASKFGREHNVIVKVDHDPCDMSVKVYMRRGNYHAVEHINDHYYIPRDRFIESLYHLYHSFFEKKVESQVPEKPKPKETPPPTNCPNCGAVITSRQCEYCGTMHWDFEEEPLRCNDIDRVINGRRVITQSTVAAYNKAENAVAALSKAIEASAITANEARAAFGVLPIHMGVPGTNWGVTRYEDIKKSKKRRKK
jgi:hypothetical protein